MRKTYKLTDLDCAHCAAKMEAAIQKIDGVSEVSVSFLTQKLTVAVTPGSLLMAFSIFWAQLAQSKSTSLNVFFMITASLINKKQSQSRTGVYSSMCSMPWAMILRT